MARFGVRMSVRGLLDCLLETNAKLARTRAQLDKTSRENLELHHLVHRLRGALLCPHCRLVWDHPDLVEKTLCEGCDLILASYA